MHAVSRNRQSLRDCHGVIRNAANIRGILAADDVPRPDHGAMTPTSERGIGIEAAVDDLFPPERLQDARAGRLPHSIGQIRVVS